MISRTHRLVIGIAAALVLAGCSSSTDGDAAAVKPDTPEEWVAQMCGALDTFRNDVDAAAEGKRPTTPADQKAKMVEVLDALGTGLNQTADRIDDLGEPPVDDLDGSITDLTDTLRQSAKDIEQLEEEARDLDETEAAVEKFANDAETRIDEAVAPVDALDSDLKSPTLDKVYEESPECEGVRDE